MFAILFSHHADSHSYDNSSDRSSVFSTPSPHAQPRLPHHGGTASPPAPHHAPSEPSNPSLRRRKWVPAGGTAAAVRQSTLEKSLSLQAELAQQRPLSMLVGGGGGSPGGGGGGGVGDAIVNQVADTLLAQMDIERFVTENLNEHRKGILGKAVPVGNMLMWTKVRVKDIHRVVVVRLL